MNRVFWILGAVFTAIGIVLSAGGGIFLDRAMRFQGRAIAVDGQVVEMVRIFGSSSRHRSYKPVVVFTGRDGKSHRAVGRLATYPPLYRIGESVRVLYDPQELNDVSIGGSLGDKLFPGYIVGGIGVIFDLLGGSFLFFSIRRRRLTGGITGL